VSSERPLGAIIRDARERARLSIAALELVRKLANPADELDWARDDVAVELRRRGIDTIRDLPDHVRSAPADELLTSPDPEVPGQRPGPEARDSSG
jgi:hypothetical protein